MRVSDCLFFSSEFHFQPDNYLRILRVSGRPFNIMVSLQPWQLPEPHVLFFHFRFSLQPRQLPTHIRLYVTFFQFQGSLQPWIKIRVSYCLFFRILLYIWQFPDALDHFMPIFNFRISHLPWQSPIHMLISWDLQTQKRVCCRLFITECQLNLDNFQGFMSSFLIFRISL
jgi:hypothetical protein